jgi:hypothetical protein
MMNQETKIGLYICPNCCNEFKLSIFFFKRNIFQELIVQLKNFMNYKQFYPFRYIKIICPKCYKQGKHKLDKIISQCEQGEDNDFFSVY